MKVLSKQVKKTKKKIDGAELKFWADIQSILGKQNINPEITRSEKTYFFEVGLRDVLWIGIED